MTMSMDWSREKSLQLIEEYKKRDVLWDSTHEFYFSKRKKEDAWKGIAHKFKTNTEEVKKKMASLLGSFRRERCKLRTSMKEDKPTSEIHHSNWFAFEKLKFLLNRNDPIWGISGTSPENANANEVELASEDPVRNGPEEDTLLHCIPITETSHADKRTKRKRVIRNDSPIGKALKMFKNSYGPDSDDCSIYAQHIANKLRKYSDRTRIYVEHIINTTLFEADIGKYENYSPTDLQQSNLAALHNVMNSTTPFAFTITSHNDSLGIKDSSCLNTCNDNHLTNVSKPCTSIPSNALQNDVKIQIEHPSYN